MKLESEAQRYHRLRELLLPILADASVGQFDRDVPEIGKHPRDMNEILMGVQVLLEVIRQQQGELEETRVRTGQILAEVLATMPRKR